jgi:hypothetical protein
MLPPYASAHPTSRPELYELMLVNLRNCNYLAYESPGCFRRRYESADTRKLNGIQHEKHMTSGLNGDEIAIGGRSSSG